MKKASATLASVPLNGIEAENNEGIFSINNTPGQEIEEEIDIVKDPLQEALYTIKIAKALDQWSALPLEERLEMAQLAKDITPESAHRNWDRDIERMRKDNVFIPPCIHSSQTDLVKARMAGMLAESGVIVQLGESPFNLGVKVGNETHELPEDIQAAVNAHRGIGN